RSQPAPVSEVKPPAPVVTAKREAAPAKPGAPAQSASGRGRQGQGGFRNLSLNDTADGQAMAALENQRPDQGVTEGGAGGTESFLVNGSLSTGLDAPGQQGPFDYYRREGDPNRPFGEGFGGPGGPGGPGGDRGPGGDAGPGGDRGPGGFGG